MRVLIKQTRPICMATQRCFSSFITSSNKLCVYQFGLVFVLLDELTLSSKHEDGQQNLWKKVEDGVNIV